MTIRPAVRADVPAIVAQCRAHHVERAYPWPFDAARVSMTAAAAIASDEWLCLTGEGALLMAQVVDCPFGSPRFALERILRARRPGDFSVLVERFETWARGRGCVSAVLSTTHRHATFARLYRRRGYALAESAFVKQL